MIDHIISGISTAIYTEFGVNYKIYTEAVKQGLQEPCFLISCLNPTHAQFLGNRYFRTNPFVVQYFPSTENAMSECRAVLERLFDTLEIITVDGSPMRGTELHGEVEDGMLHFFVNYNCFMDKKTEKTIMESLQVHNNI